MKSLFALLVMFFLSNLAPAQTISYVFHGQNQSDYYLGFSENGRWILQHFVVTPDSMQELVKARNFESRDQLVYFLQENSDISSRPMSGGEPQFTFKVTEVENRHLWTSAEQWSDEWEIRFNQWVSENFTPDFFSDYNIATDCADAATLLRWIFAREYKLPAGSTLAGTNLLLTHEAMRREWLRLPTDPLWHKDKRFLAALDYIANNTYTHTLFNDTYPVEISQTSLLPGVVNLSLGAESGHTRIVARTDYSGEALVPITLYWSTLPKEVRKLQEEPFIDSHQPDAEHGGFLKFRWVIKSANRWELLEKKRHSLYSKEQYGEEFKSDNFALAVYKKLIPGFDPSKPYVAAIEDLIQYVAQRIPVVEDGFAFCQNHDCSPGSQNWENWSTPSRDKRILEKIQVIESFIDRSGGLIDPNKWSKAQEETLYEINGDSLKLKEIGFLWSGHLYSSDPRLSIERRWALNLQAAHSNLLDSLKPIINERSSLVDKGADSSCKNYGCDFLSEDFTKHQSFDLDEKLKSLAAAFMSYCQVRSQAKACQQEVQLPSADFQILGKQVALGDFLEDVPWLISDPRVSAKRRWGQAIDRKLWQQIPGKMELGSPYIDKNGLVRVNERLYYNVDSRSELSLPNDCHRLLKFPDLDKYLCGKDEFAALNSQTVINIYDLNQKWIPVSLTDEITDIKAISALPFSYISIYDAATSVLYLFKLTEDRVEKVRQYSVPLDNFHELGASSKSFLIVPQRDNLIIVSFSKDGIQEWKVPANLEPGKINLIHEETDNWFVVSGYRELGDGGQFVGFLDKKTLQIELIDPSSSSLMFFNSALDIAAIHRENEPHLALFSNLAPGKTIQLMTFDGDWMMPSQIDDEVHLLIGGASTNERPSYYRIKNKVVESFESRPGERVLVASHGWVMYLNTPTGVATLSNFNRSQTISAPPGGGWFDLCWFGWNSSCIESQPHYFWHSVVVGDKKWQLLYSIEDKELKTPLMSRSVNNFGGMTTIISAESGSKRGSSIEWAPGYYFWTERLKSTSVSQK